MYSGICQQAYRVDLLTGGYALDSWEKALMYVGLPLLLYQLPYLTAAVIVCMGTYAYAQPPPPNCRC